MAWLPGESLEQMQQILSSRSMNWTLLMGLTLGQAPLSQHRSSFKFHSGCRTEAVPYPRVLQVRLPCPILPCLQSPSAMVT